MNCILIVFFYLNGWGPGVGVWWHRSLNGWDNAQTAGGTEGAHDKPLDTLHDDGCECYWGSLLVHRGERIRCILERGIIIIGMVRCPEVLHKCTATCNKCPQCPESGLSICSLLMAKAEPHCSQCSQCLRFSAAHAPLQSWMVSCGDGLRDINTINAL